MKPKLTQKQSDAINSLNLSDKTDELKETENIFLENQMNNLICNILKRISKLQDSGKLNMLDCTTKSVKNIIWVKFYCILYF